LGTVRPPDIIGGATGCSASVATGGAGLTRTVGGTPIGDTGIFNCTTLGRPDGGIPSTTPPGGGGSTAVPEPFTIVGTLIGGTVALGMRKKLRSTDKT
jgi:hypothetical protein